MTYPLSYLAPVELGWGDLEVRIRTELEADVTQSHQVATLVELVEGGIVGETIWNVVDGSVTLDSTAASRGRLDLSIAGEEWVPTSRSSPLAPFGNELRVSRGVVVPGSHVELVRLGIFGIQTAVPSDSGGQLVTNVTGIDRSGRFTESPFEAPYTVASGTIGEDAILAVLQDVWTNFGYDFVTTNTPLLPLFAQESDDRWAFAQGIATALGCELYFTGTGRLTLQPIPTVGGDPVDEFSEGEGGVLVEISREWDRSPVYNRVIVTGENPEEGDDPVPRGVATDYYPGSSTNYDGPFGHKPMFWSYSGIHSDTEAQNAANGILLRTLGSPQNLSFSTLVNPSRRPGDLIRIRRERLGIDEDHIIDAITIPLTADGAMTAATRHAVTFA